MKLVEHINKLITEEYGISNELSEESKKIVGQIEDAIASSQKKRYGDYKFSEGNFVHKFIIDFVVKWKFYNCLTKVSLNEFFAKYSHSYWDNNGKRLFIPAYMYDGAIDTKFLYNSVFHELEHMYQNAKSGKSFSNRELYSEIGNMLHNSSEIIRSVGQMLYFSFPEEQDAYANGMYGEFVASRNNGMDVDDIIKNSEAWKYLKLLHKDYSLYLNKKNDSELNEKLKKLKIDKNIDRILKKAINDYQRKIARVALKIKQEYYKDISKKPLFENKYPFLHYYLISI